MGQPTALGWIYLSPAILPAVAGTLVRVYADPDGEHTVRARIRHAEGGWRWMESTLRDFRDRPAVPG